MSSRPRDRRPRDSSRPVQISKKLSWLLRHGADSENLPLGPGGYANLADVLANRKIRPLHVTLAEVRALVAENDKQRFTLVRIPLASASSTDETGVEIGEEGGDGDDDEDPSNYRIRANQGHSVKVDADGLLTPITLADGNVPGVAVHGTTHRAWTAIVASGGLKPMGRNHVHLAAGLPKGFEKVSGGEGGAGVDEAAAAAAMAAPVISGMRNSSTVLVYVDVKRAVEAGIKFWVSDNGVILSEGNGDGVIPVEVFERVEDRTGEGILVLDGKVVKEAPAKWAQGRK